ncbi:WXG100-like domain-containing protein [Streptomyces sp. NPDC001107]
MSVEMPPELAWVSRLAVGQSWPKGDEDDLHALGLAWHEAARELKGISGELGSSGNGVLESVGGQVAEEFRNFVTQLQASLPEMAESAHQLGKLGKHTAVQVEYAKYMIIGQLILLAAQIAQWILFAPEVIPAAITETRVAVKMILQRLAISVATGVALNVGLDVAVQTIQFLKGDRTQWSKENTVSAVVSGAIGGGMGGIFFGVGSVLRPKFAHSLLGKGILGAATGLSTAGIMYRIYKSGEDDLDVSVSAGVVGALGGGGKRRFGGGKGDTVKVDPVHVNVPGALKFDVPGPMSAEKTALPGTDTVKEKTGDTKTAGTNGTGKERGNTTTPGTKTPGAGHGVPRTGNSTPTHGTAHGTSTPVAARHEQGLPGFTTTVTTAQATTTSTTAGSSATRTATTATAPARTSAGVGSIAGTAGPSPSLRTETGTSAGTETGSSVRTETGSSVRTETSTSVHTETGASVRTETGASVHTETGTPPATDTRAQAGTPPNGDTLTQAGPEAVKTTGSTAAVTTETRAAEAGAAPHGHAAVAETATTTAPHREAAASTPDPTPPPGESPRAPAPRMRLDRTPRFVVRSAFEARRFMYRDEPVTDVTVRVAFREGGNGHDVDAVWQRMSEGVQQYLNDPGYRLPHGDRLHVTVLHARPGEEPHLTVDLVGHDRPMDQQSWWADAQPVDFAHEIAHKALAMRDEYTDETAPQRADVKGSLMGDYRAAAPGGLRQGGLRDRHLQLAFAVIGDLGEATATRHADQDPASVARPHDETLPHDEEWARAWHGAKVHERRHAWVDPVSDPLGVGRGLRPVADGGRTTPAVDPRTLRADQPRVSSSDNSMIMQPGYASGDQFGILMTLLAEPNRHVLIAGGPDAGQKNHNPTLDKSRAIESFYRENGIGPERIWRANVDKLEQKVAWRELNKEAARIAREHWGSTQTFDQMYQRREQSGGTGPKLLGVGNGTDYVASHFSPEHRSTLRSALRLDDHRDAEITAWLAGRGIHLPQGDKGVLVLWSRFTGKSAQWSSLRSRMEHDTSFEGTRQLLRNLAADYKAVIITGDPHPDPAKAGKWDELVQEMRTELGNDNIHNLTAFWRGPKDELGTWGGDTRTGQFKLYDHLDRQHGGVQHIGFRSGNLESVALIGHRVRYLEEKDASGSKRMEAWHEARNGRTRSGGLAPGYERTVVKEPATASGRYSKKHELLLKKKAQQYEPPALNSAYPKPVEVYAKERGFDYTDVQKIRADLRLAESPQGRAEFDAKRLDAVRRRFRNVATAIRQAPEYRHQANKIEKRYLAPIESFLNTDAAEFENGSSGMYAAFVKSHMRALPRVWDLHRTFEENARRLQQATHSGDEVPARAPVADGVVTQSDGTATMTRPPRSESPEEQPQEHPSLSAVPNTDGLGELRQLPSSGATEEQARPRDGMPEAEEIKAESVNDPTVQPSSTTGLPEPSLTDPNPGADQPRPPLAHTDSPPVRADSPLPRASSPLPRAESPALAPPESETSTRPAHREAPVVEPEAASSDVAKAAPTEPESEPRPEPTPQPIVAEPEAASSDVAKTTPTEPEPRPEPTPQPIVVEPEAASSDVAKTTPTEPEPEPKPEPMVVEPDGDPATPPPPGDDPAVPEPVDRAVPSPTPPVGPRAQLPRSYELSLAGIEITDAPGPEQLRARVLQSLPTAHRTEPQVVQKLDAEFDPANFRARHDEMVNGGRRFRLWVGGAPHEVVLTAEPGKWRLRAEQTPAEEKDTKGFERSAEAKRQAEPKKTSLTASEAGLELAPTVIRPVPGHDDQLAMVTPSVKVGGASHATDTSVKSGSETGTKTTLTGPTDTYVSRFRYKTFVFGPDGQRLPRPADGAFDADVTAEITRAETDRPDGLSASWQGWESDHPGRAEGRPLDVTGLSELHKGVFRQLPREERPDGTAHDDILEFLSPKNIVDGFEHAAGWGLTSKRLDLSDGGHAWLRLTLEPTTSTHEGTVSDKDTFTSKESGEHAAGRSDTSTWSLGLNGGGMRRLWESPQTKESTWLTATGGYTYAHNRAHAEKGKQTFSLEHSLEHAGTGDLVRTAVRFRVEVLREHLSPGTDGLHAVRREPDPGPARGQAPRDEENPPAVPTGEVVRLRPHPATTAAAEDTAPGTSSEASSSTSHAAGTGIPGTDTASDTRPVPADLRAPLTAQRTTFVDVPGSLELERHITDRLREMAPGILPPADGAEGRVTPQAMENQRLLREHLSRSGLRAAGGQLLDGTFRITLDASHLPGLPGRTYQVVIGAHTDPGRHDGSVATTAKTTVTRSHASDKGVTRSSKHTLGVSGNGRRALNPRDTVRVFGLGGVDGSYAPSRQTVASSEIQAKRAFQHKGQADAFSYPVRYRVLVGPYREGDQPTAVPDGRGDDERGQDLVHEVVPPDDARLRVEVRRPEASASAPRYLRSPRLPQLHAVTHVADEAGFREQARTALEHAYESRRDDGEPHIPPLDEAVADLTGRAQLPGLISASHSGWANTLDRHVGTGRRPDTVGLSVRTRLTELNYRETLSGKGTLDLELKASGGTAVTDQSSWSAKGNIGPDAGRFPETATGLLTTGYQVRGGGKFKAGGQSDRADTFKQQTSVTRKAGHTGTWHVYRATAEVSVAGRVTDAAGKSYVGRPSRRYHDMLVLLSDEDVARLHTATSAATAPTTTAPQLRPTLLEQGVSGGVLVELPDTDPVLLEIDRQLRGPADGTVPVAALPFADTYSPDSLAARYDELVGPGVLDRHVEVTRTGRVVTEVLVRGITDGWRDDGSRSERPLTRDVSAAHTVKGKAGHKWSAGAEANLRGSVRPPVDHFNSASIAPSAAFEAGRGSSAESGVTTTVGHKTSGFGDVNARFTTKMTYEVTVTRRTETGRFVRLAENPKTVGPYEATAWVPESLTQDTAAAPHPGAPDAPARTVPSATGPFGIELGRLPGPDLARHLDWQDTLRGAHDLVGFDNTKALHNTAVQVQANPRPWGDGLLGQTGAYSSWVLAQGAGLGRWAVRSALPERLTRTVSRFLDTFTADPRLDPGHDLNQEQRLTLEEQFAIRQAFSGQSLPALFHRLGTPNAEYRVPGTSVALSMEAIGAAEELSRRDTADDELTVAVKDESGTAATHGYNWTVSPLDFAVLTEDPVVTVPLVTGRMAREQDYESTRPVTRSPGTPTRPTPDSALPHGRTATEPGKAKVKGPAALMRQPVRITVRGHDDEGPYGTPRTVTGHLFHWSAPGRAPSPSTAPAPRRPAAAPPSRSAAAHPDEVAARAPRTAAPRPAETTAPAPHTGRQAPTPAPAPTPAHTHGIAFAAEDVTTPGPAETARVDAIAAGIARDSVGRAEAGLKPPVLLFSGHATASVSGLPHFGRAVQIGAELAENVRGLFARRLDAHLRDLGSALTSDAFVLRVESRGSDLPRDVDPAHDTPEARRRVVITVTHPRAAGGEPPLRPEQWRSRRDHAVWAVLRTERYDPARDPAADRPGPGLLAGRDVVVRVAVARIQADDGRWVRNLSLHLPVRFGDGFGPGDLGPYRERLQSLLDTHVNDGRRLPGSGDQLHIDVDLEHRPDHPEAVEISRSDRPERAWDQFTFPLGTHEGIRDDARALHELMHYAGGLKDRYQDPEALFRRHERQTDRTGLMADIDTIDVPAEYLRTIAEVTESGPVLRDLPYRRDDGEQAVLPPGPTGSEAREILLSVDPGAAAPVRPPAAAPFAGHSAMEVSELVRRVRHGNTAMDHGRNWRGEGRHRFDPSQYHVRDDDGRHQAAPPWADGAYVVLARASGNHITLETPSGKVRLKNAEDFAALLADDPLRRPDADIVLAVRGLPSDALGLPEAVFAATGNRVWTPSGGSLELKTVRTRGRTVERVELSGPDPHWAPTTSAEGPDHFAHLRAQHLVTAEYTATTPDGVLFHRLPVTHLEAHHSVVPSDPDSPALLLPAQSLDVVSADAADRPAIQVSQDGTLAVDAGGLSQHAYATERAVEQANAKLAAAGSKVRLAADPEASLALHRADGTAAPRLLRITPRFLTGSGRSEEEACRDFAQMVSGQVRASNVVFRVPGRQVVTGRISALDTAEVTGTHHLAQALVQVVDGLIAPDATGPAWAAAQIARDDRGVGGQGGAPLPGEAYGTALSHEYVDNPRRDALTRAARRTGINAGAWAEVGEGYLVQSINAATADGRPTLEFNHAKPWAKNARHFGYHFASVVLASEDGHSQLTLENHARVGRNRTEMNSAVEENLRSTATELRALAASLHDRVRVAEQLGAPPDHRETPRSRARLAGLLVELREARDRGVPANEQQGALRTAETLMLHTAPMIDGKAQWYFRSYSRRPGESMHESHAELLSGHASAEANPLTLVVLHGHAVSAPEHRFIPFDASGDMADSAGYKLDHLAEHLVRTGLWNLAHGLPLPTTRLTGHADGRAPHLDRDRTTAMATLARHELLVRIAAILRDRAAAVTAEAFTISVAAGLRRDSAPNRGPEVTFHVDHWRTPPTDDEAPTTS